MISYYAGTAIGLYLAIGVLAFVVVSLAEGLPSRRLRVLLFCLLAAMLFWPALGIVSLLAGIAMFLEEQGDDQ